MEIRDAVRSDFEQITAIYKQIVLTSTAIYNDEPVTVEDRLAWWKGRREQGYPVLVAAPPTPLAKSESVAETRPILGFASFGDFRAWPGYRFTVEGTVHIHSSSRGQGVGSALLKELVRRARQMGKYTMVAGVDADNAASLRFLQRFGFERVGHFRDVGFKFGRFLDLVFLQYWLSRPTQEKAHPNLHF
jgi:L-amino acid N-acyltransferase